MTSPNQTGRLSDEAIERLHEQTLEHLTGTKIALEIAVGDSGSADELARASVPSVTLLALLSELQSLRAADGWLPIEEAPEYGDDGFLVGRIEDDGSWDYCVFYPAQKDFAIYHHEYTHYKPITPPDSTNTGIQDTCNVCGWNGGGVRDEGCFNLDYNCPRFKQSFSNTDILAAMRETERDFAALRHAIVGDTGLSAILEATRMREREARLVRALKDLLNANRLRRGSQGDVVYPDRYDGPSVEALEKGASIVLTSVLSESERA